MNWQCTQRALLVRVCLSGTVWGSAVTVIDHWTGASATALRLAMRLTREGFADKLGVSVRAVAKWRAKPTIMLSPQFQQILDTVLGQIDESTHERFSVLLAQRAQMPPPPARRMSSRAAKSSAAVVDRV